MYLHPYLPAAIQAPVAIAELALGGVILAVWLAFATLSATGWVLQIAIDRGWVDWPPPNTTLGWRAGRPAHEPRAGDPRQRWQHV
ncbi:MAG: hypothetical protein ABUS56_04130 [Acidobacteriota bacterium]